MDAFEKRRANRSREVAWICLIFCFQSDEFTEQLDFLSTLNGTTRVSFWNTFVFLGVTSADELCFRHFLSSRGGRC